MNTSIIITVCLLLLLAYLFDISSKHTKIPSVILLLLLGWAAKQGADLLHFNVPSLAPLLPIFGTIGLILIVLEGSLELHLDRSKVPMIKKSFVIVLTSMLVMALVMAAGLQYVSNISLKTALVNAIPFCVISSAVAIPSVRHLSSSNKEFVIYESSLSDIMGVLFFNFIAFNRTIDAQTFGHFGLQLLLVIVLSFIGVLGLSFLLSRIRYHITFTPIILFVILIYCVSKEYHLPGLIFIFVFGLFLGNLDGMKGSKWIDKLHPRKLGKEVAKFKHVTQEATFFIRALFFIMFGFLMEAKELLNLDTLPMAIAIVLLIIIVRWVVLKAFRFSLDPLLFIAPRGLITILLFMTILPENSMTMINKSLIIQSIVLSVLVMMFGLVLNGKKDEVIDATTEVN
jgi:potassium/hydrogen antiporter